MKQKIIGRTTWGTPICRNGILQALDKAHKVEAERLDRERRNAELLQRMKQNTEQLTENLIAELLENLTARA